MITIVNVFMSGALVAVAILVSLGILYMGVRSIEEVFKDASIFTSIAVAISVVFCILYLYVKIWTAVIGKIGGLFI